MTMMQRSSSLFSLRPGAASRLRRDALLFAIFLAGYLLLGSLVRNSYYQLMMTLVPIWAAIGLAWKVGGKHGLISGFLGAEREQSVDVHAGNPRVVEGIVVRAGQ